MKSKKYYIICIVLLFTSFISSQTADLDFNRAMIASDSENWEKAIQLLQIGIHDYPKDSRFPALLGRIYYNQELFKLSYKYLKKALDSNPKDISLYKDISDTCAFLNDNEQALKYMDRYLIFNPDDLNACATYGWLCYKLHQSKKGISFLKQIIVKYGGHGYLYATLATLYSELYDYKNSKYYYEKAISYALDHNHNYTASIYYYNQAILEGKFYNFNKAYLYAEKGVEFFDQPSVYSMLFELYIMQNDFQSALNIVLKSMVNDNTPIMEMNLISLYVITGYWDEALLLVEQVKNNNNHAWISNFGLSVFQFKSELCEYEKKIYLYKYYDERMKIKKNLIENIVSLKRQFTYYIKYLYLKDLYKVYLLKVAKEFTHSHNTDNYDIAYDAHINLFYYLIFKNDYFKAIKYLRRAEKIEVDFIPEKKSHYNIEKGILQNDIELLNTGMNSLNVDWEKQELAEALAQAITMVDYRYGLYYEYILRLFNLNPTWFYYYNIKLPVEIHVQNKSKIKHVKSLFKHSILKNKKKSPFKLYIDITNNEISFKLLHNNTIISRESYVYKDQIVDACNEFISKTFKVDLK